MPILIVNLDRLNLRELFKIEIEQVGNVEVIAIRHAHALEINTCDAIVQLKFTITSKAVVESNPTIGVSFCKAGTFEIFIEQRRIHAVATHIAESDSFKGRQVIFITVLADPIDVDFHI